MKTEKRESLAVENLALGKPGGIDRGLNVVSYCVLFIGLGTIVVTGLLVVRSYSGMPTADQWMPIEWLAAHNGIAGWNFLWEQHNEHRLVFPNIFYLADIYVFHARSIFLLISIFAIQGLHLLVWTVVLAKRLAGANARVAVGIAAFCLFRPTQMQNFIWGFQVCFMLTILASVIAFASLIMGLEPRSGRLRRDFLLAAILAGAIASFSSANGLLVWPVLVAAGIALRQPKKVLGTCIGAGAVCGSAYFWGYTFTANPLGQTVKVAGVAEYFLYYFGASLDYLRAGKWSSVTATLVLAASALAVFAMLASYARAFRRDAGRFRAFLASTGLFCVATAAMTALGRAHRGVEQAAEGRYQSYAMLFWLCLILLTLDRLFKSARSRSRTLVAGVTATVIVWMVIAAAQVPAFARAIESQKLEEETATVAIATHAWDPVLADFSAETPVMEKNAQALEFLKRIGDWIYSEQFYRAWGEPLSGTYPLAAPGSCKGELTEARAEGGSALNGLRLRGWGWDNESKARVEQVLIVGPDDRVIGIGRGSDHEFPKSSQTADPRAWFAFVRPISQPVFLRAYAIVGEPGRACLLAERP